MGSQPNERLFFLDWLRIAALAALILYHIGMIYVPWVFHIKSPQASSAMIPWMSLTSPWRMSLIFMVSGVATAYMLRGTPSLALLRQRAKQLLLPLLFGIVLVVPPQSYIEVIEKHGYTGNYFDFLKLYFTAYRGFCGAPGGSNISKCLILPTWNHLWFLPYLFIYSSLLCLAAWAFPKLLPTLECAANFALRGLGLLLIPMLWVLLARLALREAYPQSYAIAKDWFSHALYGGAFAWGLLLALRTNGWPELARFRWLSLASAITVWAILVFVRPGKLPEHVVISVYVGAALSAAFGFAYSLLNRDHPLRRHLTQAVFPVYIFHQTVLITAFYWLKPLAWPVGVEAGVIMLLTFTLSYAIYLALGRAKLLRAWLGLRT